jgi:flagella basal body P-ring formation protein FlgA
MMFFAPFAVAACLTLPAGVSNITAADLHLDGAPPDTVLSYAPAPGTQRVFHVSELRQFAVRFHLANVPDDDVCVERVTAPLDQPKVLAAMQAELPGAKIEILEVSKQAVPEGEIIFHRAGLRNNSASGVVWFGVVRYAPNRDFTIWARLTVAVHSTRVVAATDLETGKPIEASQLRIEERDEFPSTQPVVESLAQAVGRCPRTMIRAGSQIRRDMLDTLKDVRNGDVVEVDVQSGHTHLMFEARAEGSGAVGEKISVVNPSSTKRFLAKIEAKGKVSLDVPVMQ